MENKDVRVLLLNPAPSLIKYGIKWGFEQLGCYVYLMDGEDSVYMLGNNKPLALEKIERCIKKHEINLLFTEGYAGMPYMEIREICNRYNVKIHHWCIEDPVTPHIGEHVLSNRLADYMWTTTQEFIPKYEKGGMPTGLLLFACNPDFEKPTEMDNQYKHDISIIGTNYSNRFDKTKEFIIPLIERDFDIKIYGLWWENTEAEVNLLKYRDKNVYWNDGKGGHVLPFEILPTVVNSSKIMVGLNCSDLSITQTSCRPFETLSSSGESVYLAYYTKGQDNIFGDYIVQAKTGREMVEKANDILTWSDAKRRAFAQKGREYVQEHHNYKLRAEQVVNAFKNSL